MSSRRASRRLLAWLTTLFGLAAAGGVVVPVAAYVAGKRLIGAYEGKYGLQDYVASIYRGAAAGEIPAWLMLLTPALLVVLWWGIGRLWPRTRGPLA